MDILKRLAALGAVALAGCTHQITTNPDTFSVDPAMAARLANGAAVTFSNAYKAESPVSMTVEKHTYVVEQKQMTDTAIAMLRRALEKQGVGVPAQGGKPVTLRVHRPLTTFRLIGLSPRYGAGITVDAELADGTVVSSMSVNESPLSLPRAYDGAILFALNKLVVDEKLVAYVKGDSAVASAVSSAALTPPMRHAPDFKAIVGRWQGTLYYRAGAFPATLTIGDDGRWEHFVPNLSRPGPRFVGTTSIINGKFRYRSETTGLTGTFGVHEVNGERVLNLNLDDGTARGEYRPAGR